MHGLLAGIVGPISGVDELLSDGFAGSYSLLTPLLEACFNSSGGSGDDEDELDDLPAPPVLADAAAQSAVTRYHDELMRTHRRNNRRQETFRKRLEAAEDKAKLAPPEGAVVLSADDAKAYESYKALGKPDEIKASLDEREKLATEVATTKKREHLAAVAQAAGFKPTLLAKYHADDEYEVREHTSQEDGKTVTRKVAYIKVDGTFKPLADHAEAEWADELPALRASADDTQRDDPSRKIQYPPQPPAKKSNDGSNPLEKYLAERNDAVAKVFNPFAPKQSASL